MRDGMWLSACVLAFRPCCWDTACLLCDLLVAVGKPEEVLPGESVG